MFAIVFFAISTLVAADECTDICSLIPGACSSKGSYCKNGHACMDLFWFSRDEMIICNHADEGCIDLPVLLCSDAAQIVISGNSAGIQSLLSSVSLGTTISPEVTTTAAHIQEDTNSCTNGMTQLLRHSNMFMSAFRSEPLSPIWPGVTNHFESNNLSGLVQEIENLIPQNIDYYGRMSLLGVLFVELQTRSSAIRSALGFSGTVQCITCNASRSFEIEGPLAMRFRNPEFINITQQVVNEISFWINNRCVCTGRGLLYYDSYRCPEESYTITLSNSPSVLILSFNPEDERIGHDAVIPSELSLPIFTSINRSSPGFHTDSARRESADSQYRLIGLVRRISSTEYRSFLNDNETGTPDLSLRGVSGAVYERL